MSYCSECQEISENEDSRFFLTPNNRLLEVSSCGRCGCTKKAFIVRDGHRRMVENNIDIAVDNKKSDNVQEEKEDVEDFIKKLIELGMLIDAKIRYRWKIDHGTEYGKEINVKRV